MLAPNRDRAEAENLVSSSVSATSASKSPARSWPRLRLRPGSSGSTAEETSSIACRRALPKSSSIVSKACRSEPSSWVVLWSDWVGTPSPAVVRPTTVAPAGTSPGANICPKLKKIGPAGSSPARSASIVVMVLPSGGGSSAGVDCWVSLVSPVSLEFVTPAVPFALESFAAGPAAVRQARTRRRGIPRTGGETFMVYSCTCRPR